MRHILIAAALVIGVAGSAFAQSRTLPARSENAAQPPIDWSIATKRHFEASQMYEGRSVYEGRSLSNGFIAIVPAPDYDED